VRYNGQKQTDVWVYTVPDTSAISYNVLDNAVLLSA